MVLETWIFAILQAITDSSGETPLDKFSTLRLLRLLRLTRLRRLMEQLPELMVLVKGIISSTKSVGWTLLFLVLVMYVFAILMTTTISTPPPHDPPLKGDEAKALFGSLGDSMMSLFTHGALGDNLADAVDAIIKENLGSLWIFWAFFAISNLTLLNMLIAVLCDVISKRAEEERGLSDEYQLRDILEEAFVRADEDGDGCINESEWPLLAESAPLAKFLEANGVEPKSLRDHFEKMRIAVFQCRRADETRGLAFDDFLTRMMEMQPQRHTSVLEIELLRSRHSLRNTRIKRYMQHVETDLQRIAQIKGVKLGQRDRV